MNISRNKKTEATWNITLDCVCPFCKKTIDLLSLEDFWNANNGLKIGEFDTARSRNIEGYCISCLKSFVVESVY